MPHQQIIALGGDLAAVRSLVARVAPLVTYCGEAFAYHEERVDIAKRTATFGRESFAAMSAAGRLRWLNIAIGAKPLAEAGITAPQAADRSFALGLSARSTTLGDPRQPGTPGHRDGWLVGSPDAPPDLLLILACEHAYSLAEFVAEVLQLVSGAGLAVLYSEAGTRLPKDEEHFGFRDGISQPGVRGTVGDDPASLLTRRKLSPSHEDDAPEFSAPGEVLVWPGEFIFGYPMQDPHHFQRALPENLVDPFLVDGSFLVFRRLRQHVGAFRRAARSLVEQLTAFEEFREVDEAWLQARLVGRWPSGAPVQVFENGDPHDPPGSLDRFNNFAFRNAVPEVTTLDGETIPGTAADQNGLLCPFAAHIRKVNPRDARTNLGPATQTQKLRLLRRGIPYGPAWQSSEDDDATDRGLLFISYQRSIRLQFETLTQDWMNSSINPEGSAGHDVLVGQSRRESSGRTGVFTRKSGGPFRELATAEEWIEPTGGGYFFAPSRQAITSFLEAGEEGERQ